MNTPCCHPKHPLSGLSYGLTRFSRPLSLPPYTINRRRPAIGHRKRRISAVFIVHYILWRPLRPEFVMDHTVLTCPIAQTGGFFLDLWQNAKNVLALTLLFFILICFCRTFTHTASHCPYRLHT